MNDPRPNDPAGGTLRIKHQRRGALLIAGLLCAATGSVWALPQQPAAAAGLRTAQATGTGPEAEHLAARARAGLATDPQEVSSNLRLSRMNSRYIGIPVTVDEERGLQHRDERAAAAGNVEQAYLREEAAYAAGWLDPQSGRLHFAFTQPPSADLLARLARDLPGAEIVIEAMPHSLSELTSVHERILELVQAGSLPNVHGGSILEMENVVEVAVTGPLPTARAQVEALIEPRYGALLRVVPSTGPRPQADRNRSSGPAYGGNRYTGGCTIALTNAESRSRPGQFYMVSAGHCRSLGDSIRLGTSTSGAPLGGVIKNFHQNIRSGGSTNCDCMLVGPLPDLGRRTTIVLINNDEPYQYTAIGRDYSVNGDDGSYFNNRGVCLSGAVTAEETNQVQCANIVSRTTFFDIDGNGPGGQLFDLVSTSPMRTTGGDSGGPLGAGRNFLGIFYGGDTQNRPVFSKTSNLGGLNVDLRFNAGY